MVSRLIRGAFSLALLAGILATHPVRLKAACTFGIITSPQNANFSTLAPMTSADGRYTVFHTQASFVPEDVTNAIDVYLVDRQTCALELISKDSAGVQSPDGSTYGSVSGDGRYVAFMTHAALVPNDDNIFDDVYLRDRVAGTTTLVSVSHTTGNAAGGIRPRFSSDGTSIAFVSNSSLHVPGDTNGINDLFIRNLAAGTTSRVSVATGGGQATGGAGVLNVRQAISADGRFVAFSSDSANLVPNDTNNAVDVFRHDRQTNTTIRVSIATGGGQGGQFAPSQNPSISADGRYVVFDYSGQGLVPGTVEQPNVYLHDVETGTTTLVGVPLFSGSGPFTRWPSISANGRYVSFVGGAGFVAGDTNMLPDVFVKDMQTGAVRRASATPDGIEGNLPSPNTASIPDLSADGMVIAFDSFANNLVPDDTNLRDDVFIVEWRRLSAVPNVNLMRNGNFTGGTTNWLQFATPDMTYIDSNVTSGVFQYNRLPPPPGTTNQAVVFQQTTAQLQAGSPIVASFQLGNSSSARRRISVLIHDEDFSDLHVCTFWLPAATALQTYTMRTHTTRLWSGATISFYAATAGVDGGFNRIDNVTLMYSPAGADDQTDCVDPLAPTAPGGVAGPTLLTNGDFSAGLPPWGLFGQITSQITDGVFEFLRPAGTPAGVVLQFTGEPMFAGQILTAAFDLGNSSSVRKRVTAILHDANFNDLLACTFWLPASSPLQTFVVRGYASIAWANATLSVYPATVGADQWILLDNVTFQRTPGTVITGTTCLEPGALGPIASRTPAVRPGGVALGSGRLVAERSRRASARRIDDDPPFAFATLSPTQTRAQFWLPPGHGAFEIQVSDDGETWHTIATVESGEAWRRIHVDLTEAAERAVYLRVIRRE